MLHTSSLLHHHPPFPIHPLRLPTPLSAGDVVAQLLTPQPDHRLLFVAPPLRLHNCTVPRPTGRHCLACVANSHRSLQSLVVSLFVLVTESCHVTSYWSLGLEERYVTICLMI